MTKFDKYVKECKQPAVMVLLGVQNDYAVAVVDLQDEYGCPTIPCDGWLLRDGNAGLPEYCAAARLARMLHLPHVDRDEVIEEYEKSIEC